MQLAYLIGGGATHYKKYKVAAGHAAGIVVLRPAEGATGVSTSTTTSVEDAMGVVVDLGNASTVATGSGGAIAYSTTQGDPEAVYSVIINPDAVWRMLMVGSATNAALTQNTVTTAMTDGLSVTDSAGAFNSPDMDDGMVWYTAGTNAGQSRVITSSAATAVTVVMPFLYDDAVGDTFIVIPFNPGMFGATLSTNLLNVRQDAALGSDAAFAHVDVELNGRSDSYLHGMIADHMFSGTTT